MGQQETHVVTQNKFCVTTCSGASAPNPGTRRARLVSRRRASGPCGHGPATPAGGQAAPRCCSLAALESVCLPPRTSAFSKPYGAWLREPHGVGDCYQSPTPCRMPRIRLGRQACGLGDVPACGGEAVEPNCIRPSSTAKKQNLRANSKLQLPGSFRRFCFLIIPPTPAPIPGHSS